MDTQLVTSDDAQRMAQNLGQSFEPDVRELNELYDILGTMPTGKLKAEVAYEATQKAKRYVEKVDASEAREIATNLDKAHKVFVKALKRWRMPGELLIKRSNDARTDWEVERRRILDEERRKREQQANLFAAQQREAELQHLREIGKTQEAEVVAATPIRPVTVVMDPDAGRPDGEVMVEVWVPRRDEFGEVVFSDLGSYLNWVAQNPPMHHLVKHQYAKLKKLLTDNRGMLQPPGLIIDHKFEPRTRMEQDGD